LCIGQAAFKKRQKIYPDQCRILDWALLFAWTFNPGGRLKSRTQQAGPVIGVKGLFFCLVFPGFFSGIPWFFFTLFLNNPLHCTLVRFLSE